MLQVKLEMHRSIAFYVHIHIDEYWKNGRAPKFLVYTHLLLLLMLMLL